jgi:RNA polymerase sigma-70 factor (ECF subfamily)
MSSTEQDRHHPFLRQFTSNEAEIRAFLRQFVPSRADADDIMQEVSIMLWEKFDTFREEGNFRSARFEVLAWLRDKGRDRLVLSEKVVDLLAAAVDELEPHLERQRQAILRHRA